VTVGTPTTAADYVLTAVDKVDIGRVKFKPHPLEAANSSGEVRGEG